MFWTLVWIAAIHTILYAIVYSMWGRIQTRFAAPACEDCDTFSTKREKDACKSRNMGCIKCDEPKMNFWLYSFLQFLPDISYGALLAEGLALRIIFAKIRQSETVTWASHARYFKNPILVYIGVMISVRFFVESLKSFFNYEKYLYDSLPYETASALKRCERDKFDYVSGGTCPLYIGDVQTMSPGSGGSGLSNKHPVLAQQGIRKSFLHGIFIVYGVFALLAGKTAIEWLGNLVAGTVGGANEQPQQEQDQQQNQQQQAPPEPTVDRDSLQAIDIEEVKPEINSDTNENNREEDVGKEEEENDDDEEDDDDEEEEEEDEDEEQNPIDLSGAKDQTSSPDEQAADSAQQEITSLEQARDENQQEQDQTSAIIDTLTGEIRTLGDKIENSTGVDRILQELADVNTEIEDIDAKLQDTNVSDEEKTGLGNRREELITTRDGTIQEATNIKKNGVEGLIPDDLNTVTNDNIDEHLENANVIMDASSETLQSKQVELVQKESLMTRLKNKADTLKNKITGETARENKRIETETMEARKAELDSDIDSIETKIGELNKGDEDYNTKLAYLENQKLDLTKERQSVVDALTSDADLVHEQKKLKDKQQEFRERQTAIEVKNGELKTIESDIQKYKTQLNDIANETKQMEAKREALKVDLPKLKQEESNILDELKKHQIILKDAESNESNMKEALKTAESDLKGIQEQNDALTQSVNENEAELKRFEAEQKKYRESVTSLSKQLETDKQTLEELKEQLKHASDQEKDKLLNDISIIETNIQTNKQSLAQSNDKLANQVQKIDETKQSLSTAKESLRTNASKLDGAKQSVEIKRNEYLKSKNNLAFEKRIEAETKTKLNGLISEQESKKKEIQEVSKKISSLKTESKSMTKVHNSLKLKKEKVSSDIDNDREYIEGTKADIETSKERVDAIETQLKSRNAKESERVARKQAREAKKLSQKQQQEADAIRRDTTDTLDQARDKQVQADDRVREAETRLREALESKDGEAEKKARQALQDATRDQVAANKNLDNVNKRDAADKQANDLRDKQLRSESAMNDASIRRQSESTGVMDRLKKLKNTFTRERKDKYKVDPPQKTKSHRRRRGGP